METFAQLIDYLAYPIAAGVTVAIIIGLWQLLHTRPILRVSYATRGGISSSPDRGIHRHIWKGQLTFHNPTAYDIYAVSCISVSPQILPIPSTPQSMSAHSAPVEKDYHVQKEWPESEIFPDKFSKDMLNPPKSVRDVHTELYPAELRSFRVCFRYENKWGVPHYTVMMINGDNQKCIYPRLRPSI